MAQTLMPALVCDDKTVCPGETDDVNVVAKQFVLKLYTAQVFRGQCRSDGEQARVIQKRSPTIGMLVFLDKSSPEADGVLGSLRVEVPRVGDVLKKSGRCN